jgi:MoaA/NifB/PqqE/SkfB family radical SAM enzyme
MNTKNLIKVKQQENVMLLTWIINNICNNHCAYCPPILNTGKNHHYEWDRAKEFIHRLFEHYPKIHCSISGGEPTMSPFFKELVDIFYNSKNNTVGITTNGVKSVKYWEELAPKLSYICFSYHPSYDDSEFLEKVRAASKQTLVTVRVMMDSRHWDKAYEMYQRCYEIPEIAVEAVRILPEKALTTNIGETYTPEQERILMSMPRREMKYDPSIVNPNFKMSLLRSDYYFDDGSVEYTGQSAAYITQGKNKFAGWYCAAGLESLYVCFSGNVKIANCLQGGDRFHINDHADHQLPTKGVICQQKLCTCGTDFMISKEKR